MNECALQNIRIPSLFDVFLNRPHKVSGAITNKNVRMKNKWDVRSREILTQTVIA